MSEDLIKDLRSEHPSDVGRWLRANRAADKIEDFQKLIASLASLPRYQSRRDKPGMQPHESGEWLRREDVLRVLSVPMASRESVSTNATQPTGSQTYRLRGGPMRDYECNNPDMVECAASECQKLGRCRLSYAYQKNVLKALGDTK